MVQLLLNLWSKHWYAYVHIVEMTIYLASNTELVSTQWEQMIIRGLPLAIVSYRLVIC